MTQEFRSLAEDVLRRHGDETNRQSKAEIVPLNLRQRGNERCDMRPLINTIGNRRAAQILIICRLTYVRQMPTMRVPYAASPPASAISRSERGAREGDRSSAFCQTANKL